MPDFDLTAGNDVYVEPEKLKSDWVRVFGYEGDDTIKLFQGFANGGPGNDRLERLEPELNRYFRVQASYFDSPAGVRVNLDEGWAEDGWGTRDTLVGVDLVIGSYLNDSIVGNANDNILEPRVGDDTVDGGAGFDIVRIDWFYPYDHSGARDAMLSELLVDVNVNGRDVLIAPVTGEGFRFTLHDVEAISVVVAPGDRQEVRLIDLLTLDKTAQQTIAAGPGFRWNEASPLGTPAALGYSFVTSAPSSGVGAPGFRPFSAAEQQLVRGLLEAVSSFAGLSFTEVAEAGNSVGQLRFGVSQQAQTKGQTAMPGQQGELAGDVWMDVETMANLAPGSEGYQALIHEIGHALGLRHPSNTDPGDAWPIELTPIYDRPAMSVMSETPSPDGLWRADWGPLDVLALRYLYGARLLNSADTVWHLNAQTGASETTLIDDDGVDTLDATALLAGASIRLARGAVSDAGVNALGSSAIDNLAVIGDNLIENAIGTRFDDVLIGNLLDNRLTGGAGNDLIDGGPGTDTALFERARADYELSNSFGTLYVRARDGRSGADALTNVERLQFSDRPLELATATLSADIRATLAEDESVAGLVPTPTDRSDRSQVGYTLAAGALHGSVNLSADGHYSYQPAPNYWGEDHFAYRVSATGGSNEYVVFLSVLPANDAPTGSVGVAGPARVYETLSATQSLADADGMGALHYQWLRNGQPIAGATAEQLTLGPLDYGAQLSVAVSYIDGDGTLESVTSPATAVVTSPAVTVTGTAGTDAVVGTAIPEYLSGLDGNDVLRGGGGADTIDGGDGYDVASYTGLGAVQVNLAAGQGVHGSDTDVLIAIEAVFGSDAADVLRGADGAATQRGETLRGGGGNDTIDGGTGVDAAEWTGPRADYTLTRVDATTWTVRDNNLANGNEGIDTVTNVERFVFADRMLSFGARAEELARVAFVLWTKDIVGSGTLFSRGLSFYDGGYDFTTMSIVALQFWTADSDAQLAQRLITNSGSAKSVAQLLQTMAANGGANTVEGRAAALREIALDEQTTALIERSGIREAGLVSDHFVPGFGNLFGLLPGG